MSKGRKPIDVTELHRQARVRGQARALEKAGFKVEVDRAYSDDVDKGRVISQSPNGGTGFKDDTITLVVSRGPEAIKVPNVVGKRRNEARKILEDAGFKVRPFGPGNFTVRAQTPARDKKAKPGSSVTIAGF